MSSIPSNVPAPLAFLPANIMQTKLIWHCIIFKLFKERIVSLTNKLNKKGAIIKFLLGSERCQQLKQVKNYSVVKMVKLRKTYLVAELIHNSVIIAQFGGF